jgi:hypothetical protein
MSHDELKRLRLQEARDYAAMLRSERSMRDQLRRMERDLERFEHDLADTERKEEANLRRQHWGRDPERPEAWRAQDDVR